MKNMAWIASLFALFVIITPVICTADMSDDLGGAILNGDVQKASDLISQGADVNAKISYFDQTPLTLAISVAHTSCSASVTIARLLIDKGADINVPNNVGWPLLVYAACSNCTDMVKLLLEKGSNINAADGDGFTALMWASEDGYAETVRLLISQGADVNAKAKNGATALFLAGRFGQTNIAQLLRQAGAQE
jgi:ankyrin repeat protein